MYGIAISPRSSRRRISQTSTSSSRAADSSRQYRRPPLGRTSDYEPCAECKPVIRPCKKREQGYGFCAASVETASSRKNELHSTPPIRMHLESHSQSADRWPAQGTFRRRSLFDVRYDELRKAVSLIAGRSPLHVMDLSRRIDGPASARRRNLRNRGSGLVLAGQKLGKSSARHCFPESRDCSDEVARSRPSERHDKNPSRSHTFFQEAS